MTLGFLGAYTNKVDGKGRVSIPSPFRDVIQAGDPNWSDGRRPTFILNYGNPTKTCLEGFTVAEFQKIQRKIAAMKPGEKKKSAQRLYNGRSQFMEIDETGRIVLTQTLRERLASSNEAYFEGMGEKFQIWKPETYAIEEGDPVAMFNESFGDDFDPEMLFEDDGEI